MDNPTEYENQQPESQEGEMATRRIDPSELNLEPEEKSSLEMEAATVVSKRVDEPAVTKVISQPQAEGPSPVKPVEPPKPTTPPVQPAVSSTPAAPQKDNRTGIIAIVAVAVVVLVCICACTAITITALTMIPNF